MSQQKLRIQFRKTDDLRWISHRDLARTFERMFRRAEVPLAMSEGFHPHPKTNFPSALSLGIKGDGEWVETLLSESVDASVIEQRLVAEAPPGLEIIGVRVLDRSHPKPVVTAMTYEIRVPVERHAVTQSAIETLMQQSTCLIERGGGKAPIDLHATLSKIDLTGDRLVFTMQATRTAQAGPRDLLAKIGLDDLEQAGELLTRSHVQLKETIN